MKRLLVVSLAVVMALAMLAACTVVPAAPVGEPAAALPEKPRPPKRQRRRKPCRR